MMKKSLLRLAFSLALLLAVALANVHSVGACPRAVTKKYYAWVMPGDPTNAHYCTIPIMGPPLRPGIDIIWTLVGEESTDCDGNYATWGDITSCGGPDNVVTTSTACSCNP